MTRREPDAAEDLVARARRGLLSESEIALLAEELEREPTLRMIHEVGGDLDRATGVRVGDEALVLRAADAALGRVRESGLQAPPAEPELVRPISVSPRRRRSAAVLVAAALLGATGIAAGMWAEGVPLRWPLHGTPIAEVPKAPHSHAGVAPKISAPAPTEVKDDEPGPVPEVDPSASATRRERVPPHGAPDATAASLFKSANAARRDGDFSNAERLYSELIGKYPSSDEAGLARVSLGKLLLSHGDPSDAEREFGQYLKSGRGQLAEEALVSRAESLQKMGRARAERATWQRLLADYPSSVYAAVAKARLDALLREDPTSVR